MNPNGIDLSAIGQNINASQEAQQPVAPVAPAHHGNWFTHLLPTIGGIGGSILGGLATAGLGGEVAGGAGGAALGKSIEHALEGDKIIQGDDLTAGLEGGIGAGVGGAAGKVLGKAGEFVGNYGKGVAEKTAQDAAAAATKDGIDATATAYKDVPVGLQKAYDANGSIAHVNNMGFDATDPANLVHVGTASNDILNSTLDRALSNSGPVDLSHYPQIIKDALAKEGGNLGSFDKVALARGRFTTANTPAAQLLQQLENLGAGVAKTSSDPNELRTLTSALGKLAADNKPMPTLATGALDPAQVSRYNAINDVRDQVKKALYDRPEVHEAVKGEVGNLTAEDVGSQQLADHLNNVITSAGTGDTGGAQDLLNEISRNINVKKFGQAGIDASKVVTSNGAKGRAMAEAGIAPETAVPGAAGPNPLDVISTVASPHMGVVNKAVNMTAHVAQNPKVLATLSRIGALGEKLAPAAGVAAATSPNLGADPVGMPGGTATMGGNTMNANNTTGGVNPDSLASILHTYMGMGMTDPYLLGQTTPLVQAIAPQVQRNEMVAGQLSAMPGAFANAGGAQGTGGIMSRISAMIPGTAAHTYQAQASAAAHELAQTLGISPEAAAGLLPQLMQNQGSADVSQGILGGMQHSLAY